MDRVISLLAALVGLIALGGAILVHVNADAERQDLAAQIAEIRTSLKTGAMPAAAPSTVASAALASAVSSAEMSSVPEASASASPEEAAASSPSSVLDAAGQISALQAQVAELEQQNASQASALADAEGRLAAASSSAPAIAVQGTDALSPSALAPPSASAGSISASSSEAVASGPSTDCIPLGTRFVGKAGDKFPICHSKVVVKILGVSDGQAVIDGAGPIATGGFGNLSTAQGCTVMVFTADVTGYADLRVTCQ
jgi:hypothetical protein